MSTGVQSKIDVRSQTDADVIETLEEHGSFMSTREIADAVDKPRSTVYDALRRVEQNEYVQREKNGNAVAWKSVLDTSSQNQGSVDEELKNQVRTLACNSNELTPSKLKNIREELDITLLELTQAGEFYQSKLINWETGNTRLTTSEKHALVTFIKQYIK